MCNIPSLPFQIFLFILLGWWIEQIHSHANVWRASQSEVDKLQHKTKKKKGSKTNVAQGRRTMGHLSRETIQGWQLYVAKCADLVVCFYCACYLSDDSFSASSCMVKPLYKQRQELMPDQSPAGDNTWTFAIHTHRPLTIWIQTYITFPQIYDICCEVIF